MVENLARALNSLKELNAAGISLSIDDFGTGYASLNHLKHLPASELKIDRGFVVNMLNDSGDEKIVRSMIGLAHNLGLTVLAEGVEDVATRDRLMQLQCDAIQGHLVSEPLSAKEMSEYLAQ